MARALGESPSTVMGWKRVGRIPAEKQHHVLALGLALGLPITAENVVFPLGRSTTEIGESPSGVVCDQPDISQEGPA